MATFKKMAIISKDKLKQLMSQEGNGKSSPSSSAPQPAPPDPFVNPNMAALNNVLAEMNKVQNDTSLTADQRLGLLGELRGRFEQLFAVISPKAIPAPETDGKDKDETVAEAQQLLPPPAPSAAPPLSPLPPLEHPSRAASPPPRAASTAPLPAPPQPPSKTKSPQKESPSEEDVKPVRVWFDHLKQEAANSATPAQKLKASGIINKIQGKQSILSVSRNGVVVFKGVAIPGSKMLDLVKFLFSGEKPKKEVGVEEFFEGLNEININPRDIVNSKAAVLLSKVKEGRSPVSGHTRRRKPIGEKSTKRASPQDGKGAARPRSRSRSPPGRRPRILELYRR